MSEDEQAKIKKRIAEFEEKIQELKMEELLNIKYVSDGMKKNSEKEITLEKKLHDAQDKMLTCELPDSVRYKNLITAIKCEVELMGQERATLSVLRLLIKLLQKEEERLEFFKSKVSV